MAENPRKLSIVSQPAEYTADPVICYVGYDPVSPMQGTRVCGTQKVK